MVFVFGIDVPLVEMIFVLTIILVVLLGLLIYLVIGQVKLKRELKTVINKENVELKGLKEIQGEEKDELGLLRTMRSEMDKLLYAKAGAPREVKTVRKVRKKAVKKVPEVKTIIKKVLRRSKKIYVASKDGKTLHIKNCPFAKKIGEESRIIFRSKTKAFNSGYKACSCIKNVKETRRRRRSVRKETVKEAPIAKEPEVRTVVKTVVKRAKKSPFVASADGDTVHQENCPFAKRIDERNRVYFKTKANAFDQGYKACNCI
ncbi:MAG: hypothetical protein ABH824_02665 [Nanoarchaeota archaeon]|nr:hypothetical protein [Nanoarchaeota archaeon]MBU1632115.1 hypothetical protein [Nanoarchaeota archaeon]MBU1876180.1 hypothetical protein [Nanoarchaeota archaeon]